MATLTPGGSTATRQARKNKKTVGFISRQQTPDQPSLKEIIEKGEADLKAGHGITYTLEELQAMVNNAA